MAPLSVALVPMLLLGGYRRLQRVSLALLLFTLAFAAAGVLARPDWGPALSRGEIQCIAVVRGTVVPDFKRTDEYHALSMLGAMLTSYVYVWQTSVHVEGRRHRRHLLTQRVDAVLGSFFAVAVCWFTAPKIIDRPIQNCCAIYGLCV